MCAADDKFDLCGVNAPVQDAHLAVFKPRDILVAQQKGEVFIRSLHVSFLSLSIKALDGTLHVGAHLFRIQRLEFTVFI